MFRRGEVKRGWPVSDPAGKLWDRARVMPRPVPHGPYKYRDAPQQNEEASPHIEEPTYELEIEKHSGVPFVSRLTVDGIEIPPERLLRAIIYYLNIIAEDNRWTLEDIGANASIFDELDERKIKLNHHRLSAGNGGFLFLKLGGDLRVIDVLGVAESLRRFVEPEALTGELETPTVAIPLIHDVNSVSWYLRKSDVAFLVRILGSIPILGKHIALTITTLRERYLPEFQIRKSEFVKELFFVVTFSDFEQAFLQTLRGNGYLPPLGAFAGTLELRSVREGDSSRQGGGENRGEGSAIKACGTKDVNSASLDINNKVRSQVHFYFFPGRVLFEEKQPELQSQMSGLTLDGSIVGSVVPMEVSHYWGINRENYTAFSYAAVVRSQGTMLLIYPNGQPSSNIARLLHIDPSSIRIVEPTQVLPANFFEE